MTLQFQSLSSDETQLPARHERRLHQSAIGGLWLDLRRLQRFFSWLIFGWTDGRLEFNLAAVTETHSEVAENRFTHGRLTNVDSVTSMVALSEFRFVSLRGK